MTAKVTWTFDDSATITQFDIEKSVDKGASFSALATVLFSIVGANYDRQKGYFFYDDATGNPGDVYRVTATGPLGVSVPKFAIVPPSSAEKCTIVGFIRDAADRVDKDVEILVSSYARSQGGREDRWVKNPTGLMAQNDKALGIVTATFTVFPDDNGMWQIALIRRTVARIQIPMLNFDWAFEVPDEEGPKNIRDIQQLRPGSFHGIFPDHTGTPDRITRG